MMVYGLLIGRGGEGAVGVNTVGTGTGEALVE